MKNVIPTWKARIIILRKKITLSGLIESVSLCLIFFGISHFSQSVAFIAIGMFGIWITESGNP